MAKVFLCPKCNQALQVRMQRVQTVWHWLAVNEKGELVAGRHCIKSGGQEYDDAVACVECPGCGADFGSLVSDYRKTVQAVGNQEGASGGR